MAPGGSPGLQNRVSGGNPSEVGSTPTRFRHGWLRYTLRAATLFLRNRETLLPLALAVHGGAWNIPDEAVQPSHEGVQTALRRGWDVLREGAPALDVVEQVLRLLEDDPIFDADLD